MLLDAARRNGRSDGPERPGEAGELLSPIDEFDAPNGAVFCGEGYLLPDADIGANVAPYDTCIDVTDMAGVLEYFFEVEVPLPLPATLKAGTTVARLGPLPTLDVDGSTTERELLAGFFPAREAARLDPVIAMKV